MKPKLKILKISIPVFILAVFVFSADIAHAIFGIDYLTNWAIMQLILGIQGIVMSIIGKFLTYVAEGLAWFLKYQSNFLQDVAIVNTSWAIFRDFANMFFILILIIIAFATIFDWQGYNWKGLMPKFIFAALLINFSLAISMIFINISIALSNLMLSQFGDITANLAGGLGITKLADAMTKSSSIFSTASEATFLSTIVSFVGIIVVASIALMAMISAFIFSIARIPVLWALMILSPLAWITYILPSTRTFWNDWWKWFFGWTFFLPIYLFALMMGFVILSNRPDLTAAAKIAEDGSGFGFLFGFTFQNLFYYVLTIIILVGGLAMSLKASFAAGGGATKAFSAIDAWTKRKFYVPAMQKAGKEKLAEIKDTGLQGKYLGKLYGGERAERLRTARVAGLLGKKEAMSEAEALEVQKSYAKYQARNLNKAGLDELEAKAQQGELGKFDKFAVRKLRAENGWVAPATAGQQEMESTIKEAGENSKFAQDYLKALQKSNFSDAMASQAEAENLAATTLVPLKKAVMETMVKNNRVLTDVMAKSILDVFATDSKEVNDRIKEGLQKNIKNFEETKKKKVRAAYLLDPSKDPRVKRLLAKQMSEDGEITTYQKYKTAAELFGGENEIESRAMLNKLIKDKPLAYADILFRQKLGQIDNTSLDADYDPLSPANTSPQKETMFADEIREKLPKMGAKAINEVDVEIWKRPVFETVLGKKISDLETAQPSTVPRPGKRGKAGAGKRYIQRIMKTFETDPDPDKEAVLERIIRTSGIPWP